MTYLQSLNEGLVARALGNGDTLFVIEHKDKIGWYLFDYDIAPERTECIWIRNKSICIGWTKREVVEKILSADRMPEHNIIKLIT